MSSQWRNVTLLGSNLIFLAVSMTLFLNPGLELALYPGYALIFLFGDFRKDSEVHVIFLFLVMTAALLLMARASELAIRMALTLEAAGLWLFSLGLDSHREALIYTRRRIFSALEDLNFKIRDCEREMNFYSSYEKSALGQIQLRRDLTHAAKTLANTMDAREVQLRLLGILEGHYKGSRVEILPGSPQDPLVSWSIKTNAPVLVRDIREDSRFPDNERFRSALVVPMKVLRKPYAFLRMDSEEPKAYGSDDLRHVDLFATLASMTLENIQLYESVRELATHDALTQLFTQRAFHKRLDEELLRAGRSQSPLSLIMADIDFFKRYNDTYGHLAGDELLRTVARILVKYTRPVDCVARYGGEEFALILPNVVRSQAVEIANRIRLAVACEPFVFQGRRTQVTMSFGVASFPQDATMHSQLIRVADERLYHSKNNGRNQVT
jgi:diguanylate cyclase (GGDEF)-like protein